MSQIFISDLHLDANKMDITDAFFLFLEQHCTGIEHLYILGDLFEAWIGDDDDCSLALQTQQALRACHASGTQIFLQRGNRDFLLGPSFAQRTGAQFLADYAVISCAGEPTLIMHGDLLCTDDLAYQQFRAQVHTPQWQQHFLAQSLSARRAFSEHARQQSYQHQQQLKHDQQLDQITDVNDHTVQETLQRFGVRRLIHGHTHRPARHRIEVNGQAAERIVLGDWYTQTSHLCVNAASINLHAGPKYPAAASQNL